MVRGALLVGTTTAENFCASDYICVKQWVLVLAENAHTAITYSSCFDPSPLTGIMNSEDSDATVAEEPLSGCGSDTEPEGVKSPSLLRLALKLSDERSE